MKIALLSDSHNNWPALKEAVFDASREQCEVLFFAGDLVMPEGVNILAEFTGPVHMILGNNEFQVDEICAAAEESRNVIYHGEICDIERESWRIFMHHYPDVAMKKAKTGVYDLCIYGHHHRFVNKAIEKTRLLSPGAISQRGSQPEWGVFDTETGEFSRREVTQYENMY